jgi:hypothetical protein
VAPDLGRLKIERYQVELSYHATWTFSGLKGILGEKWAHGPIFGAYAEVGTGQVNLTPAPEVEDQRLTAVAGIRASGLLAEGNYWTRRAKQIGQEWLQDVVELLKPQRVVGMRHEMFGLYPIRNPEAVTRRLVTKYYNAEEFTRALGDSNEGAYTALDVFAPERDGAPARSFIVGVVGPPHKGMFFTHDDAARDKAWWMGVRLNQFLSNEDGIDNPLAGLESMISGAEKEFRRIVTTTLLSLVD